MITYYIKLDEQIPDDVQLLILRVLFDICREEGIEFILLNE